MAQCNNCTAGAYAYSKYLNTLGHKNIKINNPSYNAIVFTLINGINVVQCSSEQNRISNSEQTTYINLSKSVLTSNTSPVWSIVYNPSNYIHFDGVSCKFQFRIDFVNTKVAVEFISFNWKGKSTVRPQMWCSTCNYISPEFILKVIGRILLYQCTGK